MQPMNETTKHIRYEILDGMRGIAAFCVMIFHYLGGSNGVFKNTYVGVDLFFILSGFVLTHSYGEKLLSGNLSFTGFMLRRLIRLYPLLIAGVTIGTAGLYGLSR